MSCPKFEILYLLVENSSCFECTFEYSDRSFLNQCKVTKLVHEVYRLSHGLRDSKVDCAGTWNIAASVHRLVVLVCNFFYFSHLDVKEYPEA